MTASKILGRVTAPLGLILALMVAACSGSVLGTDADFAGVSEGELASDDFHTGVLDASLWEVVDPQGDGTV